MTWTSLTKLNTDHEQLCLVLFNCITGIKAFCNQSQLVNCTKDLQFTFHSRKMSQLTFSFKDYQYHMLNRDIVFLLASFQMQTHSPRPSPLPCYSKSPPSAYPSFSFFSCPPALYLSFVTEHFRPQNLSQLFFSQAISLFMPTKSPLSSP